MASCNLEYDTFDIQIDKISPTIASLHIHLKDYENLILSNTFDKQIDGF